MTPMNTLLRSNHIGVRVGMLIAFLTLVMLGYELFLKSSKNRLEGSLHVASLLLITTLITGTAIGFSSGAWLDYMSLMFRFVVIAGYTLFLLGVILAIGSYIYEEMEEAFVSYLRRKNC